MYVLMYNVIVKIIPHASLIINNFKSYAAGL